MRSGLTIIRLLFTALVVISSASTVAAEPGRWERNISGPDWRLWLDDNAVWVDDDVFLPPVDVSKLKINPPTCGWDRLEKSCEKTVNVPGTVEEHFWGAIGGTIPDVGGDYRGVSWWSTTFTLDPDCRGKNIHIDFESVNLRAEVFVNHKLVGYDVVGNTPFTVDATSAVTYDGPNSIDIRITDPVGNFSWNDNILMRWGKNLVPAVHGFGGITGDVVVRAVDNVSISDIYVQNQPNPKNVNVFVTLDNVSEITVKGNLTLTLHEWKNPAAVVWTKTVALNVPAGSDIFTFKASAKNAKLWELAGHKNLRQANLYEAAVVFASTDSAIKDSASRRFGFRYFSVGEKNGDKRFYLNGKRVMIIAAMTRGFWPKNGIFATPEMAKRDMELLVEMGYNMMLLHRAIGQPPVIEYADRMGLFTYEEPGGYPLANNREDNIDKPDAQAFEWRREKLRRMIVRDRSLPSMIIYNLVNEARNAPSEDDISNVDMVHDLDPSRIVTYNSDRNRTTEYWERLEKDPFKLHMLPFDDTHYYHGWWDQHHWFHNAGYIDYNYNNPRFYLRGVVGGPVAMAPQDSLYRLDPKEIIFWGEEGAFGTMVRLQKIKERLETDPPTGFREMEHIDWFNYYDSFLDESGFRAAYPTVDDLTMSLGRNLHYFHGRNVENVRISNVADGYNLNGWGSGSTRTDMVDMYRNPTADPAILGYYTQPLYIAVKIRDKVLPKGAAPTVDFWIVNEAGLSGKHTLAVTYEGPNGRVIDSQAFDVSVAGGEEFGQLLVESVTLPAVDAPGHYAVKAELLKNTEVKTTGFDDIFSVDYRSPGGRIPLCATLETDGVVAELLKSARGIDAMRYTAGSASDVIVVGKSDIENLDDPVYAEVMSAVENGATLVVLDKADRWAQWINRTLARKPPVYEDSGITNWGQRGRLFVAYSPYLAGLPQAEGMNWEYQCFYATPRVQGIRIHNWGVDTIVALGAQHDKEILKALVRIPVGRGQVFLSTLDMLSNLGSDSPQSSVAKKLFLNLLEQSNK